MAEHRVSMLSASLRRFEDPARSSDPRIRRLMAQLATLEPAPAPRAHFRAELRAQLVAVAPRLVAEGPSVEARRGAEKVSRHSAASTTSNSWLSSAAGWTSRISIARPLAAVTAVIAVFAMLLGGAVWISKKALPGDALYSLKRANENVALSLTTDDTAKGHKYLELAQTRAEEVSGLVSRTSSMADGSGANAAGGVNAHTAKLITSTLDSGDTDTRNGAKLLGAEAVSSSSAAPLAIMIGWAPGQLDRLMAIADRLGTGAVHDRVVASARLTAQAYARATGLKPKLGCTCLTDAPTDQLGPEPCVTACTAAPNTPSQPGTATTSVAPHQSPTNRGPTAAVSGGNGNATNPTVPSVSGVPSVTGGGGGGGPTSSGGLPVSVPGLPSLPITLPGSHSSSSAASAPPTCLISLLGVCISFG